MKSRYSRDQKAKAGFETRLSRYIRWAKNHWLISILILFGVLVTAVGTVVEKFDSIITFWHRITSQTLEVSTEDDIATSVQTVTVSTRPELLTYERLSIIGLTPEQEQVFMGSYRKAFSGLAITFVERSRLMDVISEQDLLLGRVDEESRPTAGQILVAEALIRCTYYNEEYLTGGESKLRVRIVDCTTGAIVGSVVTQGPDNFKQHSDIAAKAIKKDLIGERLI